MDQDTTGHLLHAAGYCKPQFNLNHAQLVCALGFNKNIRELTDILSVIGFTSYKLLSYRRNELFSTDTYKQLDIDNVVDIYSEYLEDPDILATLRELMVPRLENIEKVLTDHLDPSLVISYKMGSTRFTRAASPRKRSQRHAWKVPSAYCA